MSELATSEVVGGSVSASTSQSQSQSQTQTMTMALSGEIGRTEVVEVCDLLDRLIKEGTFRVVVDLSEVSHFDYRGVPRLRQCAEALRRLGGDMRLAGLSRYLYAIFRSAGAHDAFGYFETAAAAQDSFRSPILALGG